MRTNLKNAKTIFKHGGIFQNLKYDFHVFPSENAFSIISNAKWFSFKFDANFRTIFKNSGKCKSHFFQNLKYVFYAFPEKFSRIFRTRTNFVECHENFVSIKITFPNFQKWRKIWKLRFIPKLKILFSREKSVFHNFPDFLECSDKIRTNFSKNCGKFKNWFYQNINKIFKKKKEKFSTQKFDVFFWKKKHTNFLRKLFFYFLLLSFIK